MSTRNIEQAFWRSGLAPWIELRTTRQSLQAYKLHQHAQLSIGAIVEGDTLTCCDGQTYHLRPGELVVIAPEVAHSCNPVAGIPRSYHMLYIDKAWCLAQLGAAPEETLCCDQTLIHHPSLFAAYQRIVELMIEGNIELLSTAVRELLLKVPGLTARPQPQHAFYDMQLALQADFTVAPSFDRLAGHYSLRKETLIRQFKQATGLTPGAWLNNARIEFARSCLRAGGDITDVGYQSGFSDQSHFHRTFVSFTASTPRQYARGRSISDNK
ncbi:AraC family transcriptional regulator [Yokenella regensburgei]|uniref:AraC family transcriptional regulator n=1 Tax=Yokenella regensburgei TaxID=158877 RepID=UPI003F14FC34